MISKELETQLEKYVEDHTKPCLFLVAVLANDLMRAAGLAQNDDIMACCDYIYNKVPMTCWGSYEKVNKWLNVARCPIHGVVMPFLQKYCPECHRRVI
jgi:hypothetical protein